MKMIYSTFSAIVLQSSGYKITSFDNPLDALNYINKDDDENKKLFLIYFKISF